MFWQGDRTLLRTGPSATKLAPAMKYGEHSGIQPLSAANQSADGGNAGYVTTGPDA